MEGTSNDGGGKGDLTTDYNVWAYLKNSSQGYQPQMFDIVQIPYSANQQQYLKNYMNNVQILSELSSCTQIFPIQSLYLSLTQRQFRAKFSNSSIYIIDNTQFPCENGAYFQMIQPLVSIQAQFNIHTTVYQIERLAIILLFVFMIMEIMACIVLYYKLRKLKRKIKRKQDSIIPTNISFPMMDKEKSDLKIPKSQSIEIQEFTMKTHSSFNK